MAYKVIIVGCDGIGALASLDKGVSGTEPVMTHAQAVDENPHLELVGVKDFTHHKALKAAALWNTRALDISNENLQNVDIAVVAAPAEKQKIAFNYINNHFTPSLIITEGPIGKDLKEYRDIMGMSDTPILVNYPHRFEPRHISVQGAMQKFAESQGIYGSRALYDGDLLNTGLQYLDMTNWFFGNPQSVHVTHPFSGNLSCGFTVSHKACPQVVFTPVNTDFMQIWEIFITTSIGHYSILSEGHTIRIRPIESSKNAKKLITTCCTQRTKISESLALLYLNALSFLRASIQLKCTPNHALQAHKVYNMLIK